MNKIVEYMFFGLPVVAYDLHETRVSAGEAGLYAAANSEDGLARCIAHLLDDAEERRRMGNVARQRAHDELGWHRSVPRLLEAYRHAFELRKRTYRRASFTVSPRP
jgi:glycosyltransferase involved in cell wall biosynthesis